MECLEAEIAMLSLKTEVSDDECRESGRAMSPALTLYEGGAVVSCGKQVQGAATLTMSSPRHGDLVILAELVGAEFGVPLKRFFGGHRHPQVMKAKRFFCLFAHEACGVPYPRLSQFLRLSSDGARKLGLGMLGQMDERSLDAWSRLMAAYRSRLGHLAIVQGETTE